MATFRPLSAPPTTARPRAWGARETRPCARCGTRLTRLASQSTRSKRWYCGPRCKALHDPSPMILASRGRRISAPCANCGRVVEKFLSQTRSGRAIFCSNHCKGVVHGRLRVGTGRFQMPNKPRRGREEPCGTCGTPVYRAASWPADKPRYCSVACHNVAQTRTPVLKTCGRCGAPLRLKPSQAARRFCSTACARAVLQPIKRPLERSHNGRPARVNHDGYVMLWEPGHPRAFHGWVPEHRLVVEQRIGRHLTSEEAVHHVDRNKTNNDPANLEVMDISEHAVLSHTEHRQSVQEQLAELARYRERFGPLPD